MIIHIVERRALTIRPPILGKVTYNGKFAIKCFNVHLPCMMGTTLQ